MADKPEGGSWGVIRYVPSPTSLPTDKVEVEIPAFLDGWFARQDEALGVLSQALMVHPYRTIRRKHYGTNFTRLRHHDGGSPSSNTK